MPTLLIHCPLTRRKPDRYSKTGFARSLLSGCSRTAAASALEPVLKMVSYSCQAPDHDSDHTNPNHRLAMVHANHVVPTEPTGFDKPAERSFDYPPLGQDLETSITASHDLQAKFTERTELLHPFNQGSQIAAIGPDDLQPAIHNC